MKALVIEGGGMKAAYANGVLTSFEEAGYRPWDVVLGTSAGGAMAAWYSAGQARYAEETWKYAADRRILSFRRAFTVRGPLLDHEALLDIIYVQEHPIDVEAIRACPWPVIVTACDVDTGQTIYQDIREADVIAWLKATGRLPLASGPPVEIDGRRLVDGGSIDPIPVQYAVEVLGADDVTLVTNKAPGRKRSDPRILVEVTARRYPALRRGLERHQDIKYEAVQYALRPPVGVRSEVIFPSRPTRVHRLSRHQDAIQDAISLGHQDGAHFLAGRG